ncbi:MAG: glutamyl-tRNA reductase [Elusimicrobia bacterium]|nr:glutamyl-tRNA reductase [Elusimicrobiota bacterium]
MRLISLSWSHRAADSSAREALAGVPAERVLAELKARGVLEAVVLSTCNRFELYAAGAVGAAPDPASLLGALEDLAGAPVAAAAEAREDLDAVSHLFAVASGLDSLVVGETEILGQVKTGYALARGAGMTGKRLNVLFQRALFVGKKVRTETGIAGGSSSVPSVAVQLAESIFGRLEGKSALILGAGAMAELAAKHLIARGVGRLAVANRTWERAYALAARFSGEAVRWEAFSDELSRADVVIASTGAPSAVVTRAMVAEASRRRGGRSLFLIDIAMPRDVEESAHGLDGVFLYRLEDLEQIVAKSLASRAESMAAARMIVEAKAAEFDAWAKSLATGRELSLRHSERPRR